MEESFKHSVKIAVLFLPSLFKNIDFEISNVIFLSFGKIMRSIKRRNKNNSLIPNKEEDLEDLKNFSEKINKIDLSREIIKFISKNLEAEINSENDLKNLNIVLINYPISEFQFERLEKELKKMEEFNFDFSNIITFRNNFHLFLEAKSKNFLCPDCFELYDKEKNLINDEYYCPFDEKSFSIDKINKFVNVLTRYQISEIIEILKENEKKDLHKDIHLLNFDDKINVNKNELLKILNDIFNLNLF